MKQQCDFYFFWPDQLSSTRLLGPSKHLFVSVLALLLLFLLLLLLATVLGLILLLVGFGVAVCFVRGGLFVLLALLSRRALFLGATVLSSLGLVE